MTENSPHENSLLMIEANHLCSGDSPHEGQRVKVRDENDNLVEETPPCEDHIRMAEIVRWSLSLAYRTGLQRGYEIAAGTEMPFLKFANEKNPYNHLTYREDFDSFKWEETRDE